VAEEKGEKVGQYWRWEFTMKVQTTDLTSGGTRVWYGKAATKKDAKSQSAAAAYLNLSLCFLKLEQWTHAVNTATRALQGDKEPPDPKEAVLAPEKRAKALFRRAQAHCEGFGNFEKARDDLRKALEDSPGDKAVEQMLRKCELAVRKTSKAADKRLAGFLQKEAKSGDGIFDDSLRPSGDERPKAPPSTEPVKLKDGLWVMPEQAQKPEVEEDEVDLDKLSLEIAELKEESPEAYAEMREKVREYVEQQAEEAEAGGPKLQVLPDEGEAAAVA